MMSATLSQTPPGALTQKQFLALRLWTKSPVGLPMWLTLDEIADRLHTSKIGAGSIMVSLEKKGLVRRLGRSFGSSSASIVWDTTIAGDTFLLTLTGTEVAEESSSTHPS